MGKKGYNWKAREVVKTIIDNTKTKKIKVDFDDKNKFDDANELVLPSKKRKTKVKREQQSVTRILSKKQRKHLEKIVEKKKKKENRANLLEALSKVQASKEELSQLTSISSIQTQGLKRYFQGQKEEERPKKRRENVDSDEKINSVTGSRFKRINLINNSTNIDENDPNIVGFDESDNESDDSETNDVQSGGITTDDQVKWETGTSDCQTVDESEINDDQGQTKSETETNDCQTIIKGENLEETNDDQGQTKSETETNDCQTVIKTNEVKNKTKKSLKLEKNKPAIFETGTNDCQTAIESETNDDQGQTKSETKTNDCQKAKNKTISVKLEKNKPAIFVSVNRRKEIQKSRLKLPILAEEQQIMETINENSFILIAGETGSGKTTQVPQFLYEAGYAQDKIIAITEPRRVAAIAMSKRIAQEMNLSEKEISYLIRFEGNVTENTKIKFMTDGVLLKELQNDFLLSKYSVVILDEAHERSVYTDILIGLLSRIVPLRNKKNNPLKLIIMSATLRLSDFTDNSRLFKQPPPVIKVEARQFPVTIHFNKRTPDDYIKEAFNKTCKIHTKLPEGGVLIFVTGQQEVNRLVKKLRSAFPLKNTQKLKNKLKIEESNDSDSENNLKQVLKNKRQKNYLPDINLDDFGMPGENISDQESNSDSSDDEITQKFNNCQPLYTLPLYSLLSTQKQSKVFDPAPENCRLCVVSTNIAETSLTIPGIKYVVDTGKSKNKLYDKLTGVSSYQIMWTSRASADQRAGRAGRLGPGHCYRLYSSAVFNDVFQKFSIPEIQQKPVDDLYLQMKCMNIDKIINFPFPTAPDLMQLKMAEHRLEILGALKNKNVTPLGKAISQFPVLPRFGKMLALSHQQDLLPYTILIVSALSVQEVLLETPLTINNIDEAKKLRQKWLILRKQWAGTGNLLLLGDPLVLMKAIGAAEFANTKNELEKFCFENGLRQKAVIEIRKLRIQLTNEIKLNIPDSDIIVDPKLKPPSDLQAKLLRQILLSGLGDQIAKKIDLNELSNEDKTKYKYAYNAMNLQDPVYIHSNSVLKRTLPEYIIYQEIYETNKLYLRGVTAIEPAWLPTYVPHLCNISDPLLDPEPRFDPTSGKILCTVNATFGSQAWILPQTEIEFPKNADLYKWFARFLLEGKIFPKLEKYTNNLLTKPSTMVKTWAKLQPKTEILLKALISKDICRKDILKNIWEVQPKFLLHEYQKWLPETAHNEISLMWPPI